MKTVIMSVVSAAAILSSYLKLPSSEQEVFDDLHSSIAVQFKAGRTAQKNLDRLMSDSSEEVLEDNVLRPNFLPAKTGETRGRKPVPNSTGSLLRQFFAEGRTGTTKEIIAWIQKMNPHANMSSFNSVIYKMKSNGIIAKGFHGSWSKAA